MSLAWASAREMSPEPPCLTWAGGASDTGPMSTHFLGLPISLDPLIAEAKRRMRRRRVWIAASLILIGGIAAAVASMVTSGGPGSTGGGRGVHGLLSQVRSSFGDGRLLSASISGRTLTVKVAAPNEPSTVSATFEAHPTSNTGLTSTSSPAPWATRISGRSSWRSTTKPGCPCMPPTTPRVAAESNTPSPAHPPLADSDTAAWVSVLYPSGRRDVARRG